MTTDDDVECGKIGTLSHFDEQVTWWSHDENQCRDSLKTRQIFS